MGLQNRFPRTQDGNPEAGVEPDPVAQGTAGRGDRVAAGRVGGSLQGRAPDVERLAGPGRDRAQTAAGKAGAVLGQGDEQPLFPMAEGAQAALDRKSVV